MMKTSGLRSLLTAACLALGLVVAVAAPLPGSSTSPASATGEEEYSDPIWVPARGTRQVNCTFQNCSGGTYHADYALDIVMSRGDAVFPAGSGRVAAIVSDQGENCSTAVYGSPSSCPDGSGGNYVIVSHSAAGPPYSVYFHLDSVASGLSVGDWVDPATTIGGAGDSGWSDPGFVHIHYEERSTFVGLTGQDPGPVVGCENGETISYPEEWGPYDGWGDEPQSQNSLTNDGTCIGAGHNDDSGPGTDIDADGQDDLAVGTPGENSASGLVHVMFAREGENVGFVTQEPVVEESINQNTAGVSTEANVPEANDDFGASFAVGDFDGDGQADLAVGAPGENGDAGMVHVFFAHEGDNAGFVTNAGTVEETITQSVAGVSTDRNQPEPGDRFGEALAAGDFDGDGQDDLVIGAPGENDGSGMVHVLFARSGNAGFLTSDGAVEETITQNVAGISSEANVPEPGDRFGAAFAVGDFDGDGTDDLAIGAPGENGGSGLLHVLFARDGDNVGFVTQEPVIEESINQNTAGVSSLQNTPEAGDLFAATLAAGDFDGDGQDDLAVGAPGENGNAGIVHVMYAKPGSNVGFANADGVVEETISQNTPGVSTDANVREDNDFFSASIAAGDFDGDGQDDLAIGAPGENAGAGLLHVMFPRAGDNVGFLTAQVIAEESINQNTAGVSTEANVPEVGDLFAATLSAGDFDGDGQDDLAVGAPGENGRSGMLHVFFALPGEFAGFVGANGTVEETITQNVPGISTDQNVPEGGDLFGAALPGSSCLEFVCAEPAAPAESGVRTLDGVCSVSPVGGVVAGGSWVVDVADGCGVPDEAGAVLVSVWVVDPVVEGNLRLGPAGGGSTLGVVNFGANGLENATSLWVPLSEAGELELGVNGGPVPDGTVLASGVELEVLAWSGASVEPEPLMYHPVVPCAFFDSRSNQGSADSGPLLVGESISADVVGSFAAGQGGGETGCGVDDAAAAVLVNFVLIQPDGETVLVDETSGATLVFNEPLSAPFNNASAVVVPVDELGNVNVAIEGAAGAGVQVRLQVLGFFAPPEIDGGLVFVPVDPCVVFDSRTNQGASGGFAGLRVGGSTTTYDVVGSFDAAQGGGNTDCGVPVDAEAVELNLVGVNAVREGNLRVFATGTEASGGVLNFGALVPKMNNANAVVVPVSASGEIDVFMNGGPQGTGLPIAEVKGTVTGYWTRPSLN